MFTCKFLADNVRVAVVAEKALTKPIAQSVECRSTAGLAIGNNTTFAKATAKRSGDEVALQR